MTLRYVPPDGEERGVERPSGDAMPAGDRRRRALSDPKRVGWVVILVVVGIMLPLVAMPLSSLAARVALVIAGAIAILIAVSVRKETDRIRMREEMRAAPRCRACGRRYDEPLGEVVGAGGARCIECGRATG